MKRDKIAVLVVCSDVKDGVLTFLRSCELFKITPILIGLGNPFFGLIYKGQLLNRIVSQVYDKYDLLLCLDGLDTVFVDNVDTIINQFYQFNHPCVFSAEYNCFPDTPLKDMHPFSHTQYRYLNSGAFISQSHHLKKILDVINFDQFAKDTPIYMGNDQFSFQEYYINNQNDIKLDIECKLFQSLYVMEDDVEYSDRIKNKSLGTYPKIIHANGKANTAPIKQWLNKKLEKYEIFNYYSNL